MKEGKREKVMEKKCGEGEREKQKQIKKKKKLTGIEQPHWSFIVKLHILVREDFSAKNETSQSAACISSLREETLSQFGSYPSFSCNQGQMRSITTMTTSPAAIIGHVVKETEPHIMGCGLK